MATKPGTVYSTSPKMDTSGIAGRMPVFDGFINKIGSKTVPGGVLYKEAIDEQAGWYGMQKTNSLTSKSNMRAAVKLVNIGLSTDHAFDIVSKEAINALDKVDEAKAGAKIVKKAAK